MRSRCSRPGCTRTTRISSPMPRINEAWLQDHDPAPARANGPGHPSSTAVTWLAWVQAFWADDGQYAAARRARGRSISAAYLYNNRLLIQNHAAPWIQEHAATLRLRDVRPDHIEAMVMSLHQGRTVSARTANTVRQSVAVPMAEAFRLGLIQSNPAVRAPKLAEERSERGVLSLAEARTVLGLPWPDRAAYIANLLAASTGMRLGEVQGLIIDAVGDGEIEVRQSWAPMEKLKDPKWKSRRTVPVPCHVEQLLRDLATGNPWGDGLVFFGASRGRPYARRKLTAALEHAIEAAGIPKDRHVTFHSWRHFFNSQMRDRIPDHALRQLTGHRSEAMTDRYTHITAEARAAAAALSAQLFQTAAQPG